MRAARGWSIYEMGKAAGVSGQVIHNIETGKTKTSLEMLARMAWALNMSVADLAQLLEPPDKDRRLRVENGEGRECIRNNG